MAYYHRRVPLSRFERFELSGDVKKSTIAKSLPKKPDDFGSGIAAQFGLVKKAPVVKGRKSYSDSPTSKRIDCEVRNKDICGTTEKGLATTKSAGKHRAHGNGKDPGISSNSLHREISLFDHDRSDVEEGQNYSVSVHEDHKRKKKGCDRPSGKGHSSKKRRNSYSCDKRPDSSNDDLDNDCNVVKAKCNRVPSYQGTLKSKSSKHSDAISHEKNANKIRISDHSDILAHYDDVRRGNDEDGIRHNDLRNTHKKAKLASTSKRAAKIEMVEKRETFTIPKRRKIEYTSAQDDAANDNLLKSSDTLKDRKRSVNRKQKDNALHSSDDISLNQTVEHIVKKSMRQPNSTFTTEGKQIYIKIETNANSPSGGDGDLDNPPDDDDDDGGGDDYDNDHDTAADYADSDGCDDNDNFDLNCDDSHLGNEIDDENADVDDLDSAVDGDIHDLSKISTCIRNKAKCKPSPILPGNKRRLISTTKDKYIWKETMNNSIASLNNVSKINIESESKDSTSHGSSCHSEKGSSYSRRSVVNKGKAQARIINLGNDVCFIGKTKEVCDSKGINLSDWFDLVYKRLREKSTKTDKTVLNYFITLHSRFNVMETMEMNNLEVLPEEGPDTGGNGKPIRIFTHLNKDHYKQYLDEECLNSVPELIVTILYPK